MTGLPLLSAFDGRPSRGPVVAGLLVVAVVFGGFGSWAALAPLARGAVAAGQVVAEGHRKTIQHLEGGIVAEILVADGATVQAGQLLIRLDGVQAGSRLASQEAKRDALSARIARLVAERDARDAVDFPVTLVARRSEPRVAEALDGERTLLRTRRETLAAEVSLLEQKGQQEQGRIRGFEAQLAATRSQASIIRDELAEQETLLDKGLARRPRVLELRRQAADLEGRTGAITAEIGQSRIRIADAQLEIIGKRNTFRENVLADLRTAEDELAEVTEEIIASRDILTRLEVRAPQSGMVHDLKVRTVGGVITAGEALMDIVPVSGSLQIEARVAPTDIEHVAVGTAADVRFTGLPQRTTPTVSGSVTTVSPDVLTDKATEASYYLVRVLVPSGERARLGPIALPPGMPTDVILKSGERTALEYLLEPLAGSMARSFKE